MIKNILILGSIVLVAFSALIFIHFSNDHIECTTVSKTLKNADDKILKIENHICKEKYSF
jgi:hypothetical protein